LKKLKEINYINFEKSKLFINKPLHPTPLTLIKPFNLSSNNSKLLMKKRMVSVNPNEINNKISEHMRKKCESHIFKENMLLNNKIIFNKTPNKFKFCAKTERSNSKSPLKKMTFTYENSNNFFNNKPKSSNNSNNNGYCLNLEEENSLNNLSSRIEKYCNISKRYMTKKGNNYSNCKSDRSCTSSNKKSTNVQEKKAIPSKSPLKFYFEQKTQNEFSNDNFINFCGKENTKCKNTLDSANALNISTCGATSIRKMFDFDNENEKSKENCNLNKFKAKPLKKDVFNKTNSSKISSEIESFNSILEKSRQDKFALDKLEKEIVKKAKINEIKTSKFAINKASNYKNMTNYNNFQIKRNVKNFNNKIVDFDELMLTED
jgi:hypothetical protein